MNKNDQDRPDDLRARGPTNEFVIPDGIRMLIIFRSNEIKYEITLVVVTFNEYNCIKKKNRIKKHL